MNKFRVGCQNCFPLKKRPLVHCLTNEITAELLANALIFIAASPIMADSNEEVADLFTKTNSVLINLGHLSPEKKQVIRRTVDYCAQNQKPFVLDLVGIGAISDRKLFAQELLAYHPTVVKGNFSEVRSLCDLENHARGVDTDQKDTTSDQQEVLAQAMKELQQRYPRTVFLATGKQDLVSHETHQWCFSNGVDELARFTGTGDIVGALIAALLGEGHEAITATIAALSYFNCCGEYAKKLIKEGQGTAWFRLMVMDQLSTLWRQSTWADQIKGAVK